MGKNRNDALRKLYNISYDRNILNFAITYNKDTKLFSLDADTLKHNLQKQYSKKLDFWNCYNETDPIITLNIYLSGILRESNLESLRAANISNEEVELLLNALVDDFVNFYDLSFFTDFVSSMIEVYIYNKEYNKINFILSYFSKLFIKRYNECKLPTTVCLYLIDRRYTDYDSYDDRCKVLENVLLGLSEIIILDKKENCHLKTFMVNNILSEYIELKEEYDNNYKEITKIYKDYIKRIGSVVNKKDQNNFKCLDLIESSKTYKRHFFSSEKKFTTDVINEIKEELDRFIDLSKDYLIDFCNTTNAQTSINIFLSKIEFLEKRLKDTTILERITDGLPDKIISLLLLSKLK